MTTPMKRRRVVQMHLHGHSSNGPSAGKGVGAGEDGHLERSTYTEWAHHIEAGISTLAASPVHAVMRREVPTVLRSMSEETLAEYMVERGLTEAPVVDEHGRMVGFVTAVDLLRAHLDDPELSYGPPQPSEGGRLGAGFHDEHPPRAVVEDMEPVPITLDEHDSLAKALMLMASSFVDRAPVVTQDGHFVGMLHAGDVLAWLLEQRGLPRLARVQTRRQ
jgi:CBS domain-containing protein